MAGETGGTGEEGGRHGVGDRGTAERTLDHCCGRRGQVHGCPVRETSMTRYMYSSFPSSSSLDITCTLL